MWINPAGKRQGGTHAFTLLEIVVGVVVLGTISAFVVPQLTRASDRSSESALKDMLRYMRTQIQVYKAQHGEVPPGYPSDDTSQSPDPVTFVAQMTEYTNGRGRVSTVRADGYLLGPYLPEIPANPFTARGGVLIVTGQAFPEPDRSQPYGWMYCPETQQIVANLDGVDPDGQPYTSY